MHTTAHHSTAAAPRLPEGRTVVLPGRGETFVRELPGPAGAPVIILLHGWTATADLNWATSFDELGRHFRVIALDHRGHGRGMRCDDESFELARCADDVAALAAVLGIERCTVAGYSMGGPIAQLVWRRHPRLVEGLVLCATSAVFNTSNRERLVFHLLAGASTAARRSCLSSLVERVTRGLTTSKLRPRFRLDWVVEQVAGHQWTAILEAGRALGDFDSRHWLGEIDVPVAVVATAHDTVVAPTRQLELAAAIDGATVHTVSGGHSACCEPSTGFAERLVQACASVRARLTPPAASFALAA